MSLLAKKELKEIAKFVSEVFRKLLTLPTDGNYGIVNHEMTGQYGNWNDFMKSLISEIIESKTIINIVDTKLVNSALVIIRSYTDYFSAVKSELFTHDISSKNIMIMDGTLIQ